MDPERTEAIRAEPLLEDHMGGWVARYHDSSRPPDAVVITRSTARQADVDGVVLEDQMPATPADLAETSMPNHGRARASRMPCHRGVHGDGARPRRTA